MRGDVSSLALVRPKRLKDALALLAEADGAGLPLTPLAGGTDLFVTLNAGTARERRFLDLGRLDDLRTIHVEAEEGGDTLVLGALTTWTDCIRSAKVQKRLPILALAAREVGGVQIQNRGTLGGNVGNGSPAGDGLPVLLAAEARIVLQCTNGRREVPFADFYTGYRSSVRRPDELIAEIRVTVPPGRQHFRKVGTRAAQAISKVVMAAVGNRIAFGSVGPTAVRARRVEAYLDGGGRDPREAARLLGEDIRPIDDVRSTAAYRSRVAENLLVELLRQRAD